MPKIVLHEHLDGGPRPETLVALAAEQDVSLPETTPDALADWFYASASSGSLEGYLAPFHIVTSLMQDPASLHRVAREYVEDLVADGVIYAEIRFAPELHVHKGLTPSAVVAAVADGLREGMEEAKGAIDARLILCAIRNLDHSDETARLVLNDETGLVVAFDLAGGEAGYPPARHARALKAIHDAGANLTLHAGEVPSLASLSEAAQTWGAHRIGHGVAVMLDVADGVPGALAQDLLDRQVPFEVCPLSNVQTGVCDTLREHPFEAMRALGFNVTLNTDNRLMSRTSMTHEFDEVARAFGYDFATVLNLSRAAARAVFADDATRGALVAKIDAFARENV